MIATNSSTPRLLPVSPADPITSGMPFLRDSVKKKLELFAHEMPEGRIFAEIDRTWIGAAAIGDDVIGVCRHAEMKSSRGSMVQCEMAVEIRTFRIFLLRGLPLRHYSFKKFLAFGNRFEPFSAASAQLML